MNSFGSRNQGLVPMLELSLFGLVSSLVLTDVALLVVAPGTGLAESLRLLLALGAFGVVALGLVLGFVHTQSYTVGTIVSIPFIVLYAYTGLLLPWTQFSFYFGQLGVELLLGVPIIGEPLVFALFGGFTLTEATLEASFRYHYAIAGLGVVGVLPIISRSHLQRQSS